MPDIIEFIGEMANSLLQGKSRINLLEAGCGSTGAPSTTGAGGTASGAGWSLAAS